MRVHSHWLGCVGALVLMPAGMLCGCTIGTSEPLYRAEQLVAGSGGSVSGAGGRSEQQAGNGGGSGGAGGSGIYEFPRDLCLVEGDNDSEDMLFEAINVAIENDTISCLDRPLWMGPERCMARGLAATALSVGARRGPGSSSGPQPGRWMVTDQKDPLAPPTWSPTWWSTAEAETVTDALNQMFFDSPDQQDFQEFCTSARRTPYKWVSIGRIGDAWGVILSK